MLTFKSLLESQEHRNLEGNGFLFTKLKQNKLNESIRDHDPHQNASMDKQVSFEYQQHALKFEILKLEKATFIADQYFRTGKSVRSLMQEIQRELANDVEAILRESNPEKAKQKEYGLQSTYVYSHSPSQPVLCSSHNQLNVPQIKSHNCTPKIVEFTLGNKNSSVKTVKSSNQGDDVSEFMAAGKGPVSKSIKQKVMGNIKRSK